MGSNKVKCFHIPKARYCMLMLVLFAKYITISMLGHLMFYFYLNRIIKFALCSNNDRRQDSKNITLQGYLVENQQLRMRTLACK